MRLGIVWLVWLSISQIGCESSAKAPPKVSPPDLQIVSAGSEPRQVLRYRAPTGTKQKLELAIDVALSAGEMGGPMPTLQITMGLSVEAVMPNGQMMLKSTIEDITARDKAESKIPAAAIIGPLEALKGLAIDAILSPTGRLTGAKATPAAPLPPDLQQQVSSLIASFESTMMPLPEEPVGIGAVWRSSRPVEQNGLKLTAVNSVTVSAINGTVIEYGVDTDIHGQDQTIKQGDVTITVKDVVGNGGGKGTIDLAKLAVTGELAAEFRSEMSAAGDPAPTKMNMTTLMKIQTRQ